MSNLPLIRINGLAFVDAQQMAIESPANFDVPSEEELDALKPGAMVKVCVENERFWVCLFAVLEGGILAGTVRNELFDVDAIELGSKVVFTNRCVFDIGEPQAKQLARDALKVLAD